jgi:hypothetical protein
MTDINPLQIVLERAGHADPAKGAFFFWDEVKGWPAGILDILVTSGLLQQAQPMDIIECDGCEVKCIMPVIVYPAQENKAGRAFISCDKPEDMGRIKVSFARETVAGNGCADRGKRRPIAWTHLVQTPRRW